MLSEKVYCIILESDCFRTISILKLVKLAFDWNYIPIIFLQDSNKSHSILHHNNVKEILKNKFTELTEDNFKIIETPMNVPYKWEDNLRAQIDTINARAFGKTDYSKDLKFFLTNTDKIYHRDNVVIFSNTLSKLYSRILDVSDIINVETREDKVISRTNIFRHRTNEEVYFDDNLSRIFNASLDVHSSDTIQFFFTDDKFMDIIKRYDLGKIVNNQTKRILKVSDKDIDIVQKFITINKLDRWIEIDKTK